jgi:hypothetical protein
VARRRAQIAGTNIVGAWGDPTDKSERHQLNGIWPR